MIKYIILLTSIVILFSKPTSADTLLSCDNCSEQQMRDLVFREDMTLGQLEHFYVMDPRNSVLRRYLMSYEFEQGYIKEIFTASIPQDVQQASDDLFNTYHSFRANPDDSELQQIVEDFFGTSSFTSTDLSAAQSFNSASSDDDVKNCFASESMFRFINESGTRAHIYSLNLGGRWGSVVNSYNNFASRGNITVSVGIVQASFLAYEIKIPFADGGSLNVVRHPGVDTFDVVDGSAMDCNGNMIPTSPNEISGTFSFPDIGQVADFLDHIDGLPNVELERVFREEQCRQVPLLSRCTQVADHKFECVTIVPNCQR